MTDEEFEKTRAVRRRDETPDWVDEDTRVVRRPEDELDEATEIASRRRPVERFDRPEAPDAVEDEWETTEVGRRRRSAPPAALADDHVDATSIGRRRTAAVEVPEVDLDDGSTVVVRRESRRRAEAAAAAPVAGPAEDTVIARRPSTAGPDASGSNPRRVEPLTPAIYRPRAVSSASVTRAEPAPRAPQAIVDTAAVESSGRRLARRRLLVAIIVASVLAAAAAGTLIALLVGGG